MPNSKLHSVTDSEFKIIVLNSYNIAEVLLKLGYSVIGNSQGYADVKNRMHTLGLSDNDFKSTDYKRIELNNKKLELCEIFTENSTHSRNLVRKKILQNNLLPYKCAICGITKWNDEILSLLLDHINGINNDHRLVNLRFLCPNCHSLTSTFGSKNKNIKKKKIITISLTLIDKILIIYKEVKNKRKVPKIAGVQYKVVELIINLYNKKNT